ncbi:hypothetical protein QBC47DRAFT_388181 [Echria macrotheca]|uniref:Uncharacterized protein n=1 Tax=Echria macrotheca TaxID=438768 RepID=A0AAJ0B7W2_9PEZI|nr:hypothetical protein QBC47DRAFT_388181 [Echria macrotheca]
MVVFLGPMVPLLVGHIEAANHLIEQVQPDIVFAARIPEYPEVHQLAETLRMRADTYKKWANGLLRGDGRKPTPPIMDDSRMRLGVHDILTVELPDLADLPGTPSPDPRHDHRYVYKVRELCLDLLDKVPTQHPLHHLLQVYHSLTHPPQCRRMDQMEKLLEAFAEAVVALELQAEKDRETPEERRIRLLREYNEVKDATQAVMGRIAANLDVAMGSLSAPGNKYGVGPED